MTKKQQIIQAFKNINFKALDILLGDDRPYMNVSKKLFLNTLESELQEFVNKGLKGFDKVITGACGSCNKGCDAYRFVAIDKVTLDLFFECNEEEVTDIYLCKNLITETADENLYHEIYFRFYEEDKVKFEPSLTYHINVQRIDKAIEAFNVIVEEPLVPIEGLVDWHNRCKELSDDIKVKDPFSNKKYRAYETFGKIYNKVDNLVGFFDRNHYAKLAITAFNLLDVENEKEILKWLIEHDNHGIYGHFKGLGNWKKTGFVELDIFKKIVVDCSEILEAFLFHDLYYSHYNYYMNKYEPTEEHYKQNGGSVDCSLYSFLRLHKVHLDILP